MSGTELKSNKRKAGRNYGIGRILAILLIITIFNIAAFSVFAEPPKEGPPKEGELKEKPPKEGPLKEGELKEKPPKEGPLKEGQSQDVKKPLNESVVKAIPTKSTVLVNKKAVVFEAYNIGGNNYFKLRDLAFVLNGTQKQFEVTWDGTRNAIIIQIGRKYTQLGGEMAVSGNNAEKDAKPTASEVIIDGEEYGFIAYNISDYNYFKLRDIAARMNFGAAWDAATNTIDIDTWIAYSPDGNVNKNEARYETDDRKTADKERADKERGPKGDADRIIASFTPGLSNFYYNPPTLVNDNIYVGTSRKTKDNPAYDNYFFKLDTDLNKVWDYPLNSSEVRGGATLDSEGNIYFVVEEGKLQDQDYSHVRHYLFSLTNNGKFRWKNEITFKLPTITQSKTNTVWPDYSVGMFNPAVSANDTIYVGDGKLFAFNKNGTEKWHFPFDDSIGTQSRSAPIIDPEGNVYFASPIDNGPLSVCCFGAGSNGTPKWIRELKAQDAKGETASTPAFSTDFKHLFVAYKSTIFCVNTSDGSIAWSHSPEGMAGAFRGSPAVDAQNNIYIGTKGNEKSVFYAVKSDGSGLLWKNDLGSDLYSSPALGDDNTVYVGSETSPKGMFHALDMLTGVWKWGIFMDDVTWSSPAIDKGFVYIGTMSDINRGTGGYIYKIKVDANGLLPNAGWPRFHGSNANTGRR